jgi:hypothetical protein
MNHSLGPLEPGDLCLVWNREEHDFTPWLASTETRDALLPKLMSGEIRVGEIE